VGCQNAWYCNEKCQANDWDVHYCNIERNSSSSKRLNSKQQRKFAIVMREKNLHDGHGNIVTDQKQRLAIAFSEARRVK
jgi:hypothetical protein